VILPDALPQRLVAIAVAIVLIVALAIWFMHDPSVLGVNTPSLSTTDVEDLVASWGIWGVAGSLLLMVLHSFIPVPAEVIAVANGMCFGLLWGAVVTWSGAMLGAAAAFAIARSLGRPLVRHFVPEPRRRQLDRYARSAGTLLILRLITIVSFNVVNYAAGLAGTGWWTFLWTTALGILPMTILTAVLGARIFDVSWEIWAAIAVAMIVLWLLGRRLWGLSAGREAA
jgi:uncharacterized membrane protein YdjX (TVP38/TMEM64 family)